MTSNLKIDIKYQNPLQHRKARENVPSGLLGHLKELLLSTSLCLRSAPIVICVQCLLVQLSLQSGSPSVELLVLSPGCPLQLSCMRLRPLLGFLCITLPEYIYPLEDALAVFIARTS